MSLSHAQAVFLSWFVLAEWLLIATAFAIDTWRVYWRSQSMYATAREMDGLDLTDAARTRRSIQRWYIVVAHGALLIGVLAVYRNIFLHDGLAVDTRIFSAVLQQILIGVFFGFWRTERMLLKYYLRMDQVFGEQQEKIEVLKEERDDAEVSGAMAADTNTRIREMQDRGLEDRPEEERDRAEGKSHRSPPEDGE